MEENQRPKLRLIRGGADTGGYGDHANPHGMARPRSYPMSKKMNHPSMGKSFKPGLEVPFDGPYTDPDPAPPYGMPRPKL